MFSLPIGIMIFLMNIPLFIWGFIENGKGFLTRTLVATALVSVMIDVLTPILPAYTGDTILAAGFGGVLNSDSVLSFTEAVQQAVQTSSH